MVPDVDTIVDLLLCLTRVTIVHFIGLKPNFDALQSIVLTDEALAHQTSQAGRVSLVSNLHLLNDVILTFLKEHMVSVSTSIGGPEDLHN